MIRCTDMSAPIADTPFDSHHMKLLGRMTAAADLIAQLSDQVYLEKLLLLYQEDRESNARRYRSEVATLRKAVEFQKVFERYLAQILPQHERFLRLHFQTRWNIGENLYQKAISRQHAYLSTVLNASGASVLKHLRRRNTLKKLSSLSGLGCGR